MGVFRAITKPLAEKTLTKSVDTHLTSDIPTKQGVDVGFPHIKKIWDTLQLDHLSNSLTDQWRNIKGWMGWKNSGPPTQLFYDGKIVNSPKGLASAINSLFLKKVKKIRQNLPPPQNEPLENLKRLMATRTCIFGIKPVHPDDVLEIVKNLKNSMSMVWITLTR